MSEIGKDLEICCGRSGELEGSYELVEGLIYQPETRVEGPSPLFFNSADFHIEEFYLQNRYVSDLSLSDSDRVFSHEDCLDLPSHIAHGPSSEKVHTSQTIFIPNTLSLNCYYTNASSLNKKMLELQSTVDSFDYDLVFLSETWFEEKSVTYLNNYKVFNKNRPKISSKVKGGGVAIYVRNELEAHEVSDTELNNEQIEIIWIALNVSKILIGCIYRPNNESCRQERNKKDKLLIKALSRAVCLVENNEYDGLCIVGDFNMPKLEWNQNGVFGHVGEGTFEEELIDLILDKNVAQHVHFPTYINEKNNSMKQNILDLIFSENEDRILNVEAGPPLSNYSKTYHISINFSIQLNNQNSRYNFSSKKFSFRKAKFVDISNFFNNINWSNFFYNKNVDECYNMFLKKYYEACALFIPVNENKRNKFLKTPWVAKESKILIKQKKRLWNIIRRSKQNADAYVKEQYKSVSIQDARNYEMNLMNDKKKNIKKLYNYVNIKQKVKKSIDGVKNKEGLLISNKKEIANEFNKYFKSVFINERSESVAFDKKTYKNFNNVQIFESDISQRLSKLDGEKTPGPDGVHPLILKNCNEAFARPLCYIFKKSLEEGKVPREWKLANITPLHKKGSTLLVENYRPVSLTSIVCKICERLIRDGIMGHLLSEKLLANEQHGFVPFKSCTTNLVETLDFLTSALNKKESVDMLLLDLKNAFEKVEHEKLVTKLEAYGIVGAPLAWIKDFLQGRSQKVVLGNSESDWESVTSGVPQGSVLGPMLFIIFINDLPSNLKYSLTKMFADDCKLIARVLGMRDGVCLQNDLDILVRWTHEWNMTLNCFKCKVMHFGKNNPKTDYFLTDKNGNRVKLEESECERDLGIFVSNDLKWNKHVNTVVNRASFILGRFRKTFVSRDEKLWKKLYLTYVRPHLEFAVQAWNPYLKKDVNSLERVQRRASKIPSTLRNLEYKIRLRKWGLTTLEKRRNRGDCILMYKILKKKEALKFAKELVWTKPRFGLPKLRPELVKNCGQRYNFFANRVANTWNCLPSTVVEALSVNSFKEKYDNFYLE